MRTRAVWFGAAVVSSMVVAGASLDDAPAGVRWEGPPTVHRLPPAEQGPARLEDVQTAGLPGVLGLPGTAGPGRVSRLDPPQCVALEIVAAWLGGETFAALSRLRVAHLHLSHEGDRLCLRAVWMGGS